MPSRILWSLFKKYIKKFKWVEWNFKESDRLRNVAKIVIIIVLQV